MTTPIILSHRPTQMKTLEPRDVLGYSEGLRLTVWLTNQGSGTIELDRPETQALLRALPPALLREALGENPFLALDDPPVGAVQPLPCMYCGEPESRHNAVAGGLLCPRTAGGDGATYTPTTEPARNGYLVIESEGGQ